MEERKRRREHEEGHTLKKKEEKTKYGSTATEVKVSESRSFTYSLIHSFTYHNTNIRTLVINLDRFVPEMLTQKFRANDLVQRRR